MAPIAAAKSSACMAASIFGPCVSSAPNRTRSSSVSANFTSAPKEYSTPSFSSAWVRILLARRNPWTKFSPSSDARNSDKASARFTKSAMSSFPSIATQASMTSCGIPRSRRYTLSRSWKKPSKSDATADAFSAFAKRAICSTAAFNNGSRI